MLVLLLYTLILYKHNKQQSALYLLRTLRKMANPFTFSGLNQSSVFTNSAPGFSFALNSNANAKVPASPSHTATPDDLFDDFNAVKDYHCCICLGIVQDPVSAGCSHMVCRSCVQQHAVANGKTCPVCRAPFVTEVPTPFVALQLSQLLLKCPHYLHGCVWKGKFGVGGSTAQEHIAACGYEQIPCKD